MIKREIFCFQLDYNYVLVSADLTKKEEEEQFRAKLGQLEFVNKMEVIRQLRCLAKFQLNTKFHRFFHTQLTLSEKYYSTLC